MSVTDKLLAKFENAPTSLSQEELSVILRFVQYKNGVPQGAVGGEDELPLPDICEPRTFAQLSEPPPESENPRAIFKNGYGRKGHLALFTSISGSGKSVGIVQQLYAWGKGEAGVFGIEPVRPLRIAYIGSEDDDEELYEFRTNMRKGYSKHGWTEKDIREAEDRIIDESRSFSGLRGKRFTIQLKRLLKSRGYDVVVVNPIFSYFGVNLTNNDELNAFLRWDLEPVLKDPDHGCLMLGVHHSTKPNQNSQDGSGWSGDAAAEYIGAGGATLVNFARAILVMLPKKGKDIPADTYYRLIGAKRGKRLNWKLPSGKPSRERIVAHSEDLIFWRTSTESEFPQKSGCKIDPQEAAKDAKTLAQILKKRPMIKSDIREIAKGKHGQKGLVGGERGERACKYLIENLGQFGLCEIDVHRNHAKMIGASELLEAARNGYLAGEYKKPTPEELT